MTKKALLIAVLLLDLAMLHDLWKMPPGPMIHMMDVGQGDALLITSEENHHILIDGGVGNTVLSELSEVLPESFREIDLMVLTHPHRDHMEGLIPVLERFKVHAVLMSAPHYESMVYDAFLEAIDAPLYFAEADTDFRFGKMTLDVIYPFETHTGEVMDNINNASPVIKVDDWLLLTGDAEHEVEAQLLHFDLKVDILKAGHHGSRTSTSDPFFELVDPEIVLISAGKENDYGHPHQETIDKTRDRIVYRTDLDGRVSLGCARSWLPSFLTFPRNVRTLDQCN